MAGQSPDLYAQVAATRKQSEVLIGELKAAQRKTKENMQLLKTAWGEAERAREQRLAARTDRLRYSAYARLEARLASLPVIEQAKGIIMARHGCSEDQAFDALRRASQRENIKLRDLAASIVARTARSARAQRQGAGHQPPGNRVNASLG
jgi:hypothetical protein